MTNQKGVLSAGSIESVGSRVLHAEGAAVLHLSENLPADFGNAVKAILRHKGRVVVAGVGKSGHIGKKIAATLASTGTPAFFVHPCEASHGDLGMISQDDLCLLISNSGETTELKDIIAHCARFSIEMIAISKRHESTLMKAAHYELLIPDIAEACSIGIAPTTSTTMTLALGDALAVALMEQRGFNKESFKTFHPGGALGTKLAKVMHLMHMKEAIPCVLSEDSMDHVLLKMTSGGFGTAAVVDKNGFLIGVVTDGDLRRNMKGLLSMSAGEVATRNPVTVSQDTLAVEALALMNQHKINAIFAVNLNIPVGILTVHDCLRAGL